MKKTKWLAALQEISWVPCEESSGLPRYRAVEAYHCTFCAYTVCASCYNAIPTALLLPSSCNASVANTAVGSVPVLPLGPHASDASLGQDGPPQGEGEEGEGSPPGHCENFSKPRCFLCRKGVLVHEVVPVHEWTCEGPRPTRRLTRGYGASYDVDVVQRYYTMKEQREKRALSQEPLVAHFHGSDPPLHAFATGTPRDRNVDGAMTALGDDTMGRPPFCEEGTGFFFSVQNPRLQQSCVWCAVNRRVRDMYPSLTGEETITPLHTLQCPPSLPGLPPRRFRVGIPYGAYGLQNVHALALFLTDDIFRKAAVKLQMGSAEDLEADDQKPRRRQRTRSGQLTAGRELPGSFVRPLLVVEVLHRVATSNPVPELLSAGWMVTRPSGDVGCSSTEMTAVRTHLAADKNMMKQHNGDLFKDEISADGGQRSSLSAEKNDGDEGACILWPDGLRCDELLLVLDYLLQGRSVAVYGIASKYFFLQHIAQSAELRYHDVAVVDAYRMNSSRTMRELHEVRRRLQSRQQKMEWELVQSLFLRGAHYDHFGVDGRSEARAREQQEGSHSYHLVDSSSSPPTESPRSQSYRTPVRSQTREDSRNRYTRGDSRDTAAAMRHSQITAPPTPHMTMQDAKGASITPFTPCVKQRERSILLVRGDEDEDDEAKPKEENETIRIPTMRSDPKRKRTEEGRAEGQQPYSQLSHTHDAEAEGRARRWSRRLWLREHSDWNYNMPLHAVCEGKWPRDGGDRVTGELPVPMQDQKACPPRVTVSSPELLRSLRLACRAPHRSCVSWMSLPSITAQGLVSAGQPHVFPLAGRFPVTLLVVHGVDRFDSSLLLELQNMVRDYTYRLVLLCSFDDPNWPVSAGAGLLDSFRMAYVHLRSLLLPRVHEMRTVNSLSLLTDLEAAATGGGKFGYHAHRGISSGMTLPLHDTIQRILLSLPTTFSELLRRMIDRQEASGENVFVPMSLHQQHFDECGMMVSIGRLRAIERELTSNRLAVFNAAENKLLIPQHRKLLRVLEEVVGQR